MLTVGMGISVEGVSLLSTIIAAPVVLRLEIVASTCGVLGVAGKLVARRLAIRAKKHDENRILTKSKLNTVSDGRISDEEFRLIIDQVNKYGWLKAEIRYGAGKMHAAVAPPVLGEETIKRHHSERKRRGASQLHWPPNLHLTELCVFQCLDALTPTVSPTAPPP